MKSTLPSPPLPSPPRISNRPLVPGPTLASIYGHPRDRWPWARSPDWCAAAAAWRYTHARCKLRQLAAKVTQAAGGRPAESRALCRWSAMFVRCVFDRVITIGCIRLPASFIFVWFLKQLINYKVYLSYWFYITFMGFANNSLAAPRKMHRISSLSTSQLWRQLWKDVTME